MGRIENDENMYNTIVRLFIEVSESLRADFTSMSCGDSYAATRRINKHIANMKKILKEMKKATEYKNMKIKEARWGGSVPVEYNQYLKNKKAETEPIIL